MDSYKTKDGFITKQASYVNDMPSFFKFVQEMIAYRKLASDPKDVEKILDFEKSIIIESVDG